MEALDRLFFFAVGYVSVALATEPVVAAIDAVYLSFAQAPAGLERADPIVFRRFVRLLDRDPQVEEEEERAALDPVLESSADL
ncbi:hypothetical protein M885DRAFT_548913 [Pelagophyceae sp. CCMP2097]|nr:hypothetical protein M885DRAFT_548913 [Pelagophyceae sp. CCMP2097]